MSNVLKKLDERLHEQVRDELGRVFSKAGEVTAYDLISGFTHEQERKIVLAVETRDSQRRALSKPAVEGSPFQSHVVKLGARDQVAPDVEGWARCVRGRPVPKRLFLPVRLFELDRVDAPSPRAAAIYQDASHWYGWLTPEEEVATLDWAATTAIFESRVDQIPSSASSARCTVNWGGGSILRRGRIRRPLCSFTARSCACPTNENMRFIVGNRASIGSCGATPCGCCAVIVPPIVRPIRPMSTRTTTSLGHLETRKVPGTLCGRSHGDLHARNVMAGICDGEVEFPLMIDYADMHEQNVLAWDFVKMETELKVRILPKLFNDRSARVALWRKTELRHLRKSVDRWLAIDERDPLEERTQLVLFAFEFERRLARRTEALFKSSRTQRVRAAGKQTPLEKALSILVAIRSEAAVQLGERCHRLAEWQDEYYFALAVYGLNTAKFDDDAYRIYNRLFALVSAGVAVAEMKEAKRSFESLTTASPPPRGPYPTYTVPVFHAYKAWKTAHDVDLAENLLATASDTFDYAVALRREHALLLAKLNRHDEALAGLERITLPRIGPAPTPIRRELVKLCRAFMEVEVLSRIGRIYKDKADKLWEQLDLSFEQLADRAPAQFYRVAHGYYRQAFKLSGDYYPGGNAAVTAYLAGMQPRAERLAREVLGVCARTDLGGLDELSRYWVLVTEGDMSLLVGDSLKAADYFTSAIEELSGGNDGAVRASYAQLCRLYKALGEVALCPAIDVFRTTRKFTFEPGPLGDCGGTFSGMRTPGTPRGN